MSLTVLAAWVWAALLQLSWFPDVRAEVGPNCRGTHDATLCLGLNYVVFKDSRSIPILSEKDAIAHLQVVNSIWSRCRIGFSLDSFRAVNPSTQGMTRAPASFLDLDSIRESFTEEGALLVVVTEKWDRTGSLGQSQVNAWTSLPGKAPFGAVVEGSVANHSNLMAHELGHYLNLGHREDSQNLMNPVAFSSSVELDPSQCEGARKAVMIYWSKMLRS